MIDPRRTLPGVDVLLASEGFEDLLSRHPRGRVVEAIRDALFHARKELGEPNVSPAPSSAHAWAERVEVLLEARARPSLRDVINATGVVLHTNLGRAPLSAATLKAMADAGAGYSNLEFDLDQGARGSRYVHCVDLLRELTGAADALVVNNNAAAVVLGLNTLASGQSVLVSRGELVEIGGGFRIPDMLARSGAVLREVGTTNRTRVTDYQAAMDDGDVAAILKVHRSNFRISGFTEEAEIPALAELAAERGISLFHDLGSGLFMDPGKLGLPAEPMASESLAQGAQVVAVSGDKLLGGPQAGIILGDGDTISAMKANPLCRAFRVDKVTLAGLGATLRHYLDPAEALREIPVLAMLAAPLDGLEARARSLADGLVDGGLDARPEAAFGMVGGGTFPGVELPSWTVRVRCDDPSASQVAARLRTQSPALVARVESDELVCDLRTVPSEGDDLLRRGLKEALAFHG